ncbi:MAG: hypothetical protein CSA15_06650 [Candidatus Delongbacteria bacterium]|nr:MAG: hypothetical protein CSA15_06650 [Candidatus Delongbacteria bacterium]
MNKTKFLGNLNEQAKSDRKRKFKWRSILALILVYIVILFEMEWVWGILFFIWLIPDLTSGTTYFVEEVNRKTNPFEYWLIMGSWAAMTFYSISTLFK